MFNKLLNYFKNVWIIYFFLMLCLMEDKNFLVNLVFLNIFIFESLFQIFILYYFKKFLFFVLYFFFVLIKILCIFISVAFFTVAERKVLGAIHRRRGPNLVGFWGLLQPLADALKLFIKELIFPVKASRFIFLMAPFWILLLSVLGWVIIPFNSDLEDLTQWFMVKVYWYQYYFNLNDYANENFSRFKSLFSVDTSNGVIFLLAISSLNVYGIILAGWSSNSKYAFLGSLRSSAQMISYEVSLGLTILPVVLLANSLNLTDIVYMQQYSCIFLFPLFPCFLIFIISMLAETNRTPFDLPEAEAELVAGYNVEYSAITFAMFFLGEYSSMILMAAFCVIIFLGGWDAYEIRIFADKLIVICFFYILVRATFPRFRYDQLMQLCWKVFLPISLGYFLFVSSLVFVIVS